jgi:hypothetical protein
MRKIRRPVLLGLFAALSLSLPALGQKAPKPTNGTVAFYVPEVTTLEIRTSLTVEKPGKNPLVNGNPQPPQPGQVDGNHNFPEGTTSGGIGSYYKGLLTNAGWKEPEDFTSDGGVINFYGITKLDGGVNKKGIKCNGATDSKEIPFEAITAKEIKVVKMIRPGQGMDGSLTLVAFGVRFNPNQTFTTSTSTVATHFAATDSALAVLTRVRNSLAEAGWQAAINADGDLEISRNGAGDPVSSLYHEIEYYADDDAEENDDHWVFTVVGPVTDADADLTALGEPR